MDDTNRTNRYAILILFWAQVALLLLTVLMVVVDALQELMSETLLWQAGALFVLGLVLLVKSARADLSPWLRRFLMLTGASTVALVLSFVLHNYMYALGTMASDRSLLGYIITGLEVGFFLVEIFVFPLAFLVGAIGVIVVLLRNMHTPHHPRQNRLSPTQ